MALALLSAGCASTNNETPAGTEQTASAESENCITTATTGQAAAIGAVLGAVSGALIGTDVVSGLIGAGVGAAAGTAAGCVVASKQQDYAAQEATLDTSIAQADEYNKQLATYNDGMKKRIATNNEQIAVLETSFQNKSLDINQALAMDKELKGQIASTQKTLADARTELETQKKSYEGARQAGSASAEELAKYQAQVSTMESYVTEVEKQNDELLGQQSKVVTFLN